MDILRKLKDDEDLAELLCDISDVDILPQFREPQDEDGHLTYNIQGKTFALEGPYRNPEEMRRFAAELYEEHKEMVEEDMEIVLSEVQKELAEALGIPLYEDITELLMKFYNSATRDPRLIATYTENDGSSHCNTGSIFELDI